MDEAPTFRANKRRKHARPRNDEEESLDVNERNQQSKLANEDDIDGDEVNVSELLKLRKQGRLRTTGVRFSQQRRLEEDEETTNSMALTKVDPEEERLKEISNRFIGSTGQVVDVDKHMMAYIDSEMAKRQISSLPTLPKHISDQDIDDQPGTTDAQGSKSKSDYPSQTQLSEIDLGPDAHQINLARTEAAIVRAQSGLPPPSEDLKPRRPRKPRLGRDGKPLRPRPRKPRNSEDVARDALVEQMLHEHRMDVYEGDHADVDSGTYEDDEDADERIAEQFKQEFMDAMAERQKKNQVKALTAAKAKGVGPDSSGPKLGGSRSARAKMAQVQQQTNSQQKK